MIVYLECSCLGVVPCAMFPVSGLRVEPEMGGHTEDCFQSRGCVLGDRLDAFDYLGDRLLVQTRALSQFVSGHAQGLDAVVQRFTGGGGEVFDWEFGVHWCNDLVPVYKTSIQTQQSSR